MQQNTSWNIIWMRCDAIWFDSIQFYSIRCICSKNMTLFLQNLNSCVLFVYDSSWCILPHVVRWNCSMPCCMVCSFHCSKLSMLNIQCSTFNWVSFLFIVYRLLCLPILGGSLSIFYYAFRVPYFRCFVALSFPPAFLSLSLTLAFSHYFPVLLVSSLTFSLRLQFLFRLSFIENR